MKKLFFTVAVFLVLFSSAANAANCGGGVPCNCGDTVTASYAMTGDMSCGIISGWVLNTGADGITIDCNNHMIDGDYDGIYISNNNIAINNCRLSGFYYALIISSANDTLVSDSILSNSFSGLYAQNSEDITLSNVTMFGNYMNIDFNNSRNLNFQSPNITEYSFDNITIELETNDGGVEFNEGVTETGSNLSSDITIKPNEITVNSAAHPGLNKPANLTFRNINYKEPVILKDSVECPEPDCYILYYNQGQGVLICNVSGFSTYSAGEGFTGAATGSAPGFELGLFGILFAALLVGVLSSRTVFGDIGK